MLGNIKCLTSLQGLRSIASNCNNLQGLNLIGVRCKNIVQFWEVLSCMKLTHLALDLCVTEPTDEDDRVKLIGLYQKFVTLIAIESASSWDCCTCNNLKFKTEVSTLLAHFPSLEYYIVSDIHPKGMQNIINSCQKLKYLNCEFNGNELYSSINYCSLQELCIHLRDIHLTETFMTAISSHSGLIHVIVDVKSVSGEGVTVLVMNSPNLLTLHIYLECFDLLGFEQENFESTLKERFLNRKLFTMGGFKLEQEHCIEYEQHTNLQSFWNCCYWNWVEALNFPKVTDTP